MEAIGKYRVIGVLGKGAMGIVYKALDPDIDRVVAVKTIRFDLVSEETDRDDLMTRFIREAQAAGRLVHSNIITVYDVGREEDMTYIVMQYVEGRSLQKWIASGKHFTLEEILHLMLQLCDALEYAHKNGIIHRDIKPANILLDESGKPYIVDFGVARMEMSTITQTGTAIGTPSYMSPEQVRGQKIDSRSDIFSLGVILYELLTGQKPFKGESITTVIYKIINEEAPPPCQVKKDLPREFEGIIRLALAKDPDNRYRSCAELARDLRKLAQEKGMTLSWPALQAEEARTGIFSLRSKRGLRLGGAGLAVLAIGFGGILTARWMMKKRAGPEQELVSEETMALPDPRPTVQVLDVFGTDIDRLKRRWDVGDMAGALALARKILEQDGSNAVAKDYIRKIQLRMNEKKVARLLAEGIQSFEGGNFAECQKKMQEVLKIENSNAQALRYLALADRGLAERSIRRIIERQRKAEEEKDLLSLLADIGPEDVVRKRKTEAMTLFNNFDDIRSHVSGLAITFSDSSHARATFSYLLIALEKRTQKKKVLFEGKKEVLLEREGASWKIVAYSK
ncbi:MAG: protein kinase [Candidatus Aminicenantales bacterium]